MNDHLRVKDPLGDPANGTILTRAIIDTIREPFIILDEELRVIAASRAFYTTFSMVAAEVQDKKFYDLGGGEWNAPELRRLLMQIIPLNAPLQGYEVVHDFVTMGERTFLVNACEIRYENGKRKLLVSLYDVTEQRQKEKHLAKVIEHKNNLLKEMRHRIANSLQLIASILLLKAGSVASSESRVPLEDAHNRILSIAQVQQHLDPASLVNDSVEVAEYLSALCEGLAASMIGGYRNITLTVVAGPGAVTAEEAISFGLITTELVINSLKYAFPTAQSGAITVRYTVHEKTWMLSIEDNGAGFVPGLEATGLGTSIVASLANQLGAGVTTQSSALGTSVSLRFPAVAA